MGIVLDVVETICLERMNAEMVENSDVPDSPDNVHRMLRACLDAINFSFGKP